MARRAFFFWADSTTAGSSPHVTNSSTMESKRSRCLLALGEGAAKGMVDRPRLNNSFTISSDMSPPLRISVRRTSSAENALAKPTIKSEKESSSSCSTSAIKRSTAAHDRTLSHVQSLHWPNERMTSPNSTSSDLPRAPLPSASTASKTRRAAASASVSRSTSAATRATNSSTMGCGQARAARYSFVLASYANLFSSTSAAAAASWTIARVDGAFDSLPRTSWTARSSLRKMRSPPMRTGARSS
mmetsp:Transcript_22797/g.77104  ORF Transcript_22797/g.77104 Transcript_22797/m.77104 type:complete len:244 (+) Transcript_22797:220-951(+)